jgi:hypothetical protein
MNVRNHGDKAYWFGEEVTVEDGPYGQGDEATYNIRRKACDGFPERTQFVAAHALSDEPRALTPQIEIVDEKMARAVFDPSFGKRLVNGYHPERRLDEVYLGNTHVSKGRMELCDPYGGFEASPWRTKRLGNVAYDYKGRILSLETMLKPMFIRINEALAEGYTIVLPKDERERYRYVFYGLEGKELDEGWHPEKADDEIFMDNCLESEFDASAWGTKRLGMWAYDDKGTLLNVGTRPMFIKKQDALDNGYIIKEGKNEQEETSALVEA